ncbi:hypothetical protein C2G38_2037468 [Gigaspora rosea]|uniref:BTB domain-containing protein n=1 Tax=Gigaspora rosea TaxID=44941 RepID=A0A397V6S7_9GLOM|nr:hypothetical protein C2G38_2037468 [Gigaspora rosea]
MPNHQLFKFNKTIRDEYVVKKIKVTNISVTVFKIIIKYIYGGIILFNEIDAPTILDLMAIAKEFGLKELCNAAQAQLVNNHGWWLRQNFTKFCNDIFANHSNIIFDSEDYVNLSESALVSILKLDNLNMDEGKIWDQVIRWGVAENPDLDSNPAQ